MSEEDKLVIVSAILLNALCVTNVVKSHSLWSSSSIPIGEPESGQPGLIWSKWASEFSVEMAGVLMEANRQFQLGRN